jgi:hypothetical protein
MALLVARSKCGCPRTFLDIHASQVQPVGVSSWRSLGSKSNTLWIVWHVPAWVLKFIPNPFKFYFDRRTRCLVAGNAFRAVFIEQLQGLYPIPSNWPQGTGIEPKLKALFPALQAAVTTFRPFVPDSKKASFDQAWLNYHTSTKREKDQSYVHDMNMTSTTLNSFGGETVLPNKGKETFKRNVDRLLSFADNV